MAGRPKHYEEDTLIENATEVFWRKGYNASSAMDLMKEMNIGQGSFYRTFPNGKKQLYQKTLERFLNKGIEQFYCKLAASTNPIQFIKDFFYTIPIRTDQKVQNGCYLGNAIVELSNLDKDTKLIAVNQLDKLKEGFEKALILAKEKGFLTNEKSPQVLALHLINLWNGVNVTQRMDLSKKEVLNLLEFNLNLLD